jgi:hypothetical protein
MFHKQTLLASSSILGVVLAFGGAAHAQETVPGMTTPATFAVADDRPASDATAALSISPPPGFAPMDYSKRFRNYLVSLFGYETILRSAAGVGIR